jgi:DNA-binding response OmpR family regulator
MRVLVADHDAMLLAAIADTFAGHLDIATATGRGAAVAVLRQKNVDVVVACDTLVDYTGLELLSEVAEYLPSALLVFAASPARLKLLESRLACFGLFSTLTYPIDARKLLPTLALARRRLQVETAAAGVRHVVLEEESPDEPSVAAPDLDLGPPATSRQPKAAATAERRSTDSAAQVSKPEVRPPARIPAVITEAQRAAFQRALAQRDADRAEGRAGGGGPATASRGKRPVTRIAATRDATRRAPSSRSLSELARMAASGRPSPPKNQGPSKRAALFIGGGVLAALAVAVLNFEHSGARDVERSRTASATPPTTYSPQTPSPFAEPEGARDSLAIQGPQQPAPGEESTAVSEPQAAPVNPDTAPPDPPPPPALEGAGPMEPPSSMMPSYSESQE